MIYFSKLESKTIHISVNDDDLWVVRLGPPTVKLVYKDHTTCTRDQQSVILIHRWSLYAGYITWKVYPWGLVKCGLYK